MRRKSHLLGNASRGAMFGARLATMAVVSGAVATAVSVLGVAYLATVGSGTRSPASDGTRLAMHRNPMIEITAGQAAESPDSGESPTRERHFGALVVVDVAANVSSLDDELERQRTLADVSGQRLLLWLVVPECKPCAAVESALTSGDLQQALAKTRLVRLSATDFGAELARVGLPVDAFPGFALFGPNGYASDYLHGGEWDADTPQNIAPVLKSFVDGTYAHRRSPWHGGPHEDETSI